MALESFFEARGPASFEPQNNGCSKQQPCYSDCKVCDYFEIGNEVISIAGNWVGSTGVIKSLFKSSGFHVASMVFGNGHRDASKFIQNYQKRFDKNDIEFHLPS